MSRWRELAADTLLDSLLSSLGVEDGREASLSLRVNLTSNFLRGRCEGGWVESVMRRGRCILE